MVANTPKLIEATLKENRVGAEYEGAVYDRDLILLLDSGEEIYVFDHHNLTGNVKAQSRYTFAISVLTDWIRLGELQPGEDALTGIVSMVNWQPNPTQFSLKGWNFVIQWHVLETKYGEILITPREGKHLLEIGTRVVFSKMRFDLEAIV